MIRARDWLAQAERDLEHAKWSAERGHHAWACFAAQQSGEKAVKAALNALGKEARGHSITELLGELAKLVEVPREAFNWARALDKHYIPTRYPNAYATGAPYQYYTEEDSRRAVEAAERLLGLARRNSEVQARLREVLEIVRRYLRELRQRYGLTIRLAVLFGSWAKGLATEASDIDVLVVADGLGPDPRENYELLVLCEPGLTKISPLGFSPEEFIRRLRGLSFILLDALEDGIVVEADGDFLARVREVVRELKAAYELRRNGKGWSFRPDALKG